MVIEQLCLFLNILVVIYNSKGLNENKLKTIVEFDVMFWTTKTYTHTHTPTNKESMYSMTFLNNKTDSYTMKIFFLSTQFNHSFDNINIEIDYIKHADNQQFCFWTICPSVFDDPLLHKRLKMHKNTRRMDIRIYSFLLSFSLNFSFYTFFWIFFHFFCSAYAHHIRLETCWI